MMKINLLSQTQPRNPNTRSIGIFATAGLLSVLFAKAFLQLAFADDRPGNIPFAPEFGSESRSLGLFQVKDIQQRFDSYNGSLCVKHKEGDQWIEPSEECGKYVWAIVSKDALALIKPTVDASDRLSSVESFAFMEGKCDGAVPYRSVLEKGLFSTDFCRAYHVPKLDTKTSSRYVVTQGIQPSQAGAMLGSFATAGVTGVMFGYAASSEAVLKSKDGLTKEISLQKTRYGSFLLFLNTKHTDTYKLVRVGE